MSTNKQLVDPETGEVFEFGLDARGWEVPDPRPVELPIGMTRPETVEQMIQRMVRGRLSDLAEEQGYETFDEANDFDVEDETFDPDTPYEVEFDPFLGREMTADDFMRRRDEYQALYEKAAHREAEELERARSDGGKEPRSGDGPAEPDDKIAPEGRSVGSEPEA